MMLSTLNPHPTLVSAGGENTENSQTPSPNAERLLQSTFQCIYKGGGRRLRGYLKVKVAKEHSQQKLRVPATHNRIEKGSAINLAENQNRTPLR
jgi:hypothetical protein